MALAIKTDIYNSSKFALKSCEGLDKRYSSFFIE